MYAALTHTQNGFTALMRAAQEGHIDCVKALLEAGADKEAVDLVRSERHLFSSFSADVRTGWEYGAHFRSRMQSRGLRQSAAGGWLTPGAQEQGSLPCSAK